MKRYVPILAILIVFMFASDGWAPPTGGGGSGIPIRKVQDLLDVTKPLSPANGEGLLYGTDANKFFATDIQTAVEAGAHADSASDHHTATVAGDLDHGGITGLGDDDHDLYFQKDGSETATDAFDMGAYGFTNTGPITGATTGSFSGSVTTPTLVLDGDELYYHLGVGTSNLFIGNNAGGNNTTGGLNNTVVGMDAGVALTGGVSNLYVGYLAGAANSSSNENTAVGVAAGQHQTGARNVFIGYQSGTGVSGQSTADDNFGMGWRSLNDVITGNRNVAIGTGTMSVLTGGLRNVAIGHNAGAGLTSGDSNVFAGYLAGDATTSGSRNIIIGNSVDAPAADTDDHLNIGGGIFGNLSTDKYGVNDASPDAAWDIESKAAGDVGLIVQGAASQSANAVQIQSSAGTVLVAVDASGNITTIPSIRFTPQSSEATTTEGTVAYADGSGWDALGTGEAGLTVYDGS